MADSLLTPEHAYIGTVVFLMLTGCGLPIPEEVGIVFAGVQSATGNLNPWLAFGCCIFGCLAGDSLNYAIGHFLGYGWIRRHKWFAKWFHVEREKQMEDLIARHGLKVFFAARFLVGVRGPMYLAAGILKVPYRRFIAVDAVCATIVVGLFFTLSYYFGPAVIEWITEGERWMTVAAVLAGMVVAGFFFVRWKRRRFAKAAAEHAAAGGAPVHSASGAPAHGEPDSRRPADVLKDRP
ncbi:MAG TPA: DedA family protein [Planctomycetaceae bacterium]|nr:DedA family protein [Planctomycetaceae bacterium]